MRNDENLDQSVRNTHFWHSRFIPRPQNYNEHIGLPFSANERNKLFFNDQAKQFVDLSAVSGLDSSADGRVFVHWDFDRDGWQDIAVVNSSSPLLNLYRNEIGVREGEGAGHMVALRFVGGNHSDQPRKNLSCRDGYGVKVELMAGELRLIREHRCGEGMAAQNSATMIIGIGSNEIAESICIRWPSGVQHRVSNITAGTLLTVYENTDQSPNKTAFVSSPYKVPSTKRWDVALRSRPHKLRLEGVETTSNSGRKKPNIVLYTTMATWCVACKHQLPQLRQLRSHLVSESVQMYGVPIDDNDDREKLSEYVRRFDPAYRLLSDLTLGQRQEVRQLVAELVKTDALPSTIVTDGDGIVLMTTIGLPTVSQIRELLAEN